MIIIAGPCQHENLDLSLEIASECKRACDLYEIEYYFKASFDKANRTSIDGERGLGLDKSMLDFRIMKEKIEGLKIVTDVHSENQIETITNNYNDCVDVIQIPAFLCRQTDLIKSACSTDKKINIKKGQFISPFEVEGILSKTTDMSNVWITERGTSFGYNNLIVDFTALDYMLDNYECEIFFDATHSVQKPGVNGKSTGGNRKYVPGLLRAASALGIQNFFIETHPDPDRSPSDGPNMIYLSDFSRVVGEILRFNYNKSLGSF